MMSYLVLFFLEGLILVLSSPTFYQLKEQRPTRLVYGPVTEREWVSTPHDWYLRGDHVLKVAVRKFTMQIHCCDTSNNKNPFYGKYLDNFNVIVPGIVLGSIPLQKQTVQTLSRDYNVSKVVNMLAPYGYEQLTEFYDEFQWDELQLPTPDHVEPTVDQLEAGVEFLKANLEINATTYVHCQAGHTRSGAIVFAFLIDQMRNEKNLTEIQTFLNERRPSANKGLFQQQSVVEFALTRKSSTL